MEARKFPIPPTPYVHIYREAWDNDYSDAKLLRMYIGFSKDAEMDKTAFIAAMHKDYVVGMFPHHDAAARRGVMRYLRSHQDGQTLYPELTTACFRLLRTLTFSLMYSSSSLNSL